MLGNKIATVTLELNHNRQQDADGGTINFLNRAFTKGKELNMKCGGVMLSNNTHGDI